MKRITGLFPGRKRKAVYDDFIAGRIKKEDLTPEDDEYIMRRFMKIGRRLRIRADIYHAMETAYLTIFVKPRNWFRKPLPVVWKDEFEEGSSYPFCANCDEFAYKKDRCVFCGRRIQWDENTQATEGEPSA